MQEHMNYQEFESVVSVAIYARHSTNMQQHSTQDQIDRCKKYCADKGYEVTCIFYDEQVSGASIVNRSGVKDLIESSLCGYFEKVIAEDISRFSRDQGDISYIFKKMRFLDIALETVTEGEISELHIGLKGTMNALYLKDLGDKTHRGMVASVIRGCVPGGRAYGYDMAKHANGDPIKGLRIINEEEAEVVRYIFRKYDEGNTLKEICNVLNSKGIPSPKGGKWCMTTLIGQAARKTGLLRQSLYKGIVTFNRMAYRKHPDTGRRLSFLRPEKDWLRVPIPELALFEEDYFDNIQKKIEARSSLKKEQMLLNAVLTEGEKLAYEAERERRRRANQAKIRKASTYLVSGKMICERHDVAMTTGRKKLYNCPHKNCRNRNMRLDRDLMPMVLADLKRFNKKGINEYFSGVSVDLEKLEQKKKALENKIKSLQDEVENVFERMGKGSKTLETKMWFEKHSLQITRRKHDIWKTKDLMKVLEPISVQEKTQFLAAYQKAINKLFLDLQNERFDQDATLVVFPWIDKISIASHWDSERSQWYRTASTTYNWPKLLRALRTMISDAPEK